MSTTRSTSFDGHWTEVIIGVAETTVPHDLGRVPLDGIIFRRTSGSTIFRGSTAWTATDVYLQASTEATLIRIVLF